MECGRWGKTGLGLLLPFALCDLPFDLPFSASGRTGKKAKWQIAKGKAAEMNEHCGNVYENKVESRESRV